MTLTVTMQRTGAIIIIAETEEDKTTLHALIRRGASTMQGIPHETNNFIEEVLECTAPISSRNISATQGIQKYQQTSIGGQQSQG